MKIERNEDHELKYTIYVSSNAPKDKRVTTIGLTLCRVLYLAFGNKCRITDHKGRPIIYDPDAHDFGLGEA